MDDLDIESGAKPRHARHTRPAAEKDYYGQPIESASDEGAPAKPEGDLSGHGAHGVASDKPAKRRRGPWFVVFVIALVVFIASIAALALIGLSYCQGQQKYEEIAKAASIEPTEDIEAITVDWNALRAVNPEVVAWIYIPNTPINYPIVQASDNDKYLTIDFDGDAGWLANYGAIFLDYRNAPDFSDKASFIYGHHMNDGSMFAELARFGDQARFDECRTVYLLTPSGNYKLRTFALLHVEATDPLVQSSFADDKEYHAYLQDKIDRSIVEVNDLVPLEDMDRVFALATCDDYGAGRFVLYCRIEDDTASGLTGDLGIAKEDG